MVMSLIESLTRIKNAVYGREVREAIHDGVFRANQIADGADAKADATQIRQDAVEQYNNQMITEMTDKDVISAPEIIQARGGKDTLGQRLDETTAQLDQTTAQLAQTELKLEISQVAINVKQEPYLAIGDGNSHPLSERYGSLQEAQSVHPHAESLDDELDWVIIQQAINDIKSSGGIVYLPNGSYVLSKPLNLLNEQIAQPNYLYLRGETYKGVALLVPTESSGGLEYDNGATSGEESWGVSKHGISIENIMIQPTLATEAYYSWHPGTGLKMYGCRNSRLKDVHIGGFVNGISVIHGWLNQYDRLYIHRCRWGMTIDSTSYVTKFNTPVFFRCGSMIHTGYALKIIDSGGIDLSNPTFEITRGGSSLQLDSVRGLRIGGFNVENSENDHAILIHSSDKENENKWSSGIKISSGRLWKSKGVLFREGVKNVEIDTLTFDTNETYTPSGIDVCIYGGATVDYGYLKNINYSNCNFYPNCEPDMHKSTTSTRNFPYQSFTFENKRFSTHIPTAIGVGTWKVSDVVYHSSPSTGTPIGWVCTEAGSPGVWKPFGTIA